VRHVPHRILGRVMCVSVMSPGGRENNSSQLSIICAVMSEDTVRQTRSQKRALERDSQAADGKRLKLDGVERSRSETAVAVQDSSILKATIKVELQTGNEPMDTSNTAMKREASSPSPEDVIVLSDEEPSPPVNGGNHVKELDTDLLMRSSPKERERVIKQLKEELRLEEAKLILLKKLRQSHIHKDKGAQKPAAPVSSAPPPLVKGSAAGKTAQPVISARASGTVIPPPLVRGAQLSKHGLAGAQIILPPLVRGAQQISVLRQQQNSSGPPPLLLAPRATLSSVSGQKINQPGLIRMTSISSTGLLLSISQLKSGSNVSPSPDSRQAAKLALRKQLEKTLLEIPPPKPPSPQLTFVPSAASNQFIYLLGLEEVVQNLLQSLGRGADQSNIALYTRSFTPPPNIAAIAVMNRKRNGFLKKPSAVERHREFLLDMIASRSVSQTTNTWK
uniref:Transcriptional repressor p66-alpha-like n=1 Tax=Sinocyclocheilus anshuiensis TaxID=1608454 RepID=A0A671M5E4_9TELE